MGEVKNIRVTAVVQRADQSRRSGASAKKQRNPKKQRRYVNGSIRELPSGRYQVRLRVPNSRPPVYYSAGTFQTRKQAEKVIYRHNTQIDEGTWRHPDEIREEQRKLSLTLGELADRWLAQLHAADGTIATYRSRINNAILPALGEMTMGQLGAKQVSDWFYQLEHDRGSHYAAQAYDRLKAITSWAVERNLIQEDPCQVPSNDRVSTRSTGQRGRVVSDELIQALAKALPERFRLMAYLGGWCALREGEALGLDLEAVHQEDGFMYLEIGKQRNNKKRGMSKTKSQASNRVVPVPSWLAAEIVEHMRHCERWLFPGRKGELPVGASTWDRYWNDARDAVGEPTLRFHDLRHTALTRLGRAGATQVDLQVFGGHSDPTTAAVYQHSELNRLAQLVEVASVP